MRHRAKPFGVCTRGGKRRPQHFAVGFSGPGGMREKIFFSVSYTGKSQGTRLSRFRRKSGGGQWTHSRIFGPRCIELSGFQSIASTSPVGRSKSGNLRFLFSFSCSVGNHGRFDCSRTFYNRGRCEFYCKQLQDGTIHAEKLGELIILLATVQYENSGA